jgi:DNA polymerase-3 subunit delta'
MKAFETLCPWLTGALASLDDAARAGRLGHGWLISGPRHTGKRQLAYVLADRLLRERVGGDGPRTATPREAADDYRALADGVDLHPDLHRVRPAPDKRSVQVDQIREMSSALALTPHLSGVKVVVIEAADSMTLAAANALLKSLEEPTRNTYLLLLAERPGWLPATVRSRCQHLALRPPDPAVVAEWLDGLGLNVAGLPRTLLSRSPLAVALALDDRENILNYNQLYNEINSLYEGKANPHAMTDAWLRDDPELGLSCLVDSLRSRIRQRLVPERWTPVTESEAALQDNSAHYVSTENLFAGLKMAEGLREQLGRGLNVEIALRALLLGLEPAPTGKLNS